MIDVGMNRLSPEEAGTKSGLVGDVDFAAVSEVASAITPVPGGVGPMTIAMLLQQHPAGCSRSAQPTLGWRWKHDEGHAVAAAKMAGQA